MVCIVPVMGEPALGELAGTQREAVAIADLERAAVLTDDVAVFREAALRHLTAVGTLDVLNLAEQ